MPKKTGNPIVPFQKLKSMQKWIGDQGLEEATACGIFCKLHGTEECPRAGHLCPKYELRVSTMPQVANLSRQFIAKAKHISI